MKVQRCFSLAILLVAVSMTTFAAGMVAVTQKGRKFSASDIQILRGDTIRFNNEDKFVHQIYVESPNFTYESDEQPPGNNIDVIFTKSGLFEVRCHIHPKMLLRVDVH
ncbi:MAG TPA: hypothetical protein VHO91_03425 [Rhodopila sp.]|nr:hypothetical protein [Rhodopila sp.]